MISRGTVIGNEVLKSELNHRIRLIMIYVCLSQYRRRYWPLRRGEGRLELIVGTNRRTPWVTPDMPWLAVNYAEYNELPSGQVALIGRVKCVCILLVALFIPKLL